MDSPLVGTEWLAARLGEPDLVVADIRWTLGAPDAGRQAFLAERIRGAIFLDLDTELADRSDLRRGRHPLPDPRRFAAALAARGIGRGSRIVAYDDAGGSVAARLWWMMRWIGADGACALLDGGIPKWIAEGRPLERGTPAPGALSAAGAPHPQPLPVALHPELMVDATTVERAQELGLILLDARAPERFSGEVEPVDARAGHIPGAISAPWGENMTDDPSPVYRPAAELRAHFEALGAPPGGDGSRLVCYCGSGVTSCHNVLALELAGIRGARLYPGSWSEWVALHP